MLPYFIKRLFYFFLTPLMRLNSLLYRLIRFKKIAQLNNFVHLGPGKRKYINNWINVDSNFITAKYDIWANLDFKLPFPDDSIDAFYSHHVIEHLHSPKLHLKEIFRCLKPGGAFRIGAPNADSAFKKYLAKDMSWFSDFPEKHDSVGGKLNNFLLCKNEHLMLCTPSFLKELANGAGFNKLEFHIPCKGTSYPDIFKAPMALERETDFEFTHTLIIEGKKGE